MRCYRERNSMLSSAWRVLNSYYLGFLIEFCKVQLEERVHNGLLVLSEHFVFRFRFCFSVLDCLHHQVSHDISNLGVERD